jgi:hypothetical protein
MDEQTLIREVEARYREMEIDDWEERVPSMALPDDAYLDQRKNKWLQRPIEHRNKHPFDPDRLLDRRNRKRTRKLADIERTVSRELDRQWQILLENRELIGATGPPTFLELLVAQATYWARHFAQSHRKNYEEMLVENTDPATLEWFAQVVRDHEADLADAELLRRDPTRERHDWYTDRLLARHRATLDASPISSTPLSEDQTSVDT